MEEYFFNSNENSMLILEISNDIKDRFNGEGIHQDVILYNFNYFSKIKRVIYETTYGRLHALNFFKNLNINDLIEQDSDFEDLKDDFILFKDWLIDCLTPIEQKRKEKIIEIKGNLNEII